LNETELILVKIDFIQRNLTLKAPGNIEPTQVVIFAMAYNVLYYIQCR